ncbi:hypothetical protein ACJ72_02798 [Emergomyces africanus]|uniref:Uncharacterized protein n=1 Tax=Emergomyces africanus TaxID=1955775 RepID=A0A1B7P1X2_9EURO|nr:hypothetical protein ACJ72_02798 [Emergomyces africanus]
MLLDIEYDSKMPQVMFDKPYPLPRKRSWKLVALQGLLHRFSRKRIIAHREHTSVPCGGRDPLSKEPNTPRRFLYTPKRTERQFGPDSVNLPQKSHDLDRRRTRNENSYSTLSAETSIGPCSSTLCIPLPITTHLSQSTSLRSNYGVRDLRALVQYAALAATTDVNETCNSGIASFPETPTKFLIDFLEGKAGIENLDHFNAFLIVRPTEQGARVLYASEGLWSDEDFEKDEFFLYSKRALNQTSGITTETTDDGNERLHLMLFGGLPSIGGRSDLVLVSLIDITYFLDALTISDLEIEALIRQIYTANSQYVGQESKLKDSLETSDVMPQLVNHVVKSILTLYRDYFILAQSAKEQGYYEISHVSSNLYAEGEYVTGHLSHTPPAVISQISQLTGQAKRFVVEVNWGSDGRVKRLYFIPMMTGRRRFWLCMLVDPVHPVLWQGE